MKKLLLLFSFLAVYFTGCATVQHKVDYSENWIDDKDIQFAQTHTLAEWLPKLGNPVIISQYNDTLVYSYNYRAPLYKTSHDGVKYKPSEEDRTRFWSNRLEFVSIFMVNGKIFKVQKNETYKPNKQNQNAIEKEKKQVNAGVVAAIIAGVAAVTAIVISIATD